MLVVSTHNLKYPNGTSNPIVESVDLKSDTFDSIRKKNAMGKKIIE